MSADQRAVWRTVKMRAVDLMPGDATRNGFGKWDVVNSVAPGGEHWVTIHFEFGSTTQMRTVHLVDVQVVKPS